MKAKKYFFFVAVTMGVWASWWLATQTQAQSPAQGGRIDAFTYFIPYEVDRLDDQFDAGQSTFDLIDSDIEFIISIAVQHESSVIYYDHWEDGLEENLTSPAQLSTEVWGDNDPENGSPPGFSSDILRDGDVVVLRNLVSVPRDSSQIFYDGGDMLTSTGGALAVTITFWTERPPGPGSLFTDAWELYPTNRWGTHYIVPIGENLAGTGPNQRPGFEIVGVNVQAVIDDTTVQIDLNADGSPDETVTLDQGEQFTRIGTESGIGPDSTLVGARIEASQPVQVHLFASNPLAAYEGRGFTLVPFNEWTDDYIIPRMSDGDVWLYNPNGEPLDVNLQSISDTTTLTLPPNGVVKYPPDGLSGPTGMRFTSTDGRNFYGVVFLDATDDQDWGYVLLPYNRLATQVLIGLGLGNQNEPPDGNQSRIYVTATNNTTIFVDYNNENDSDDAPDASFDISPLAEVSISDPTDFDMTGAFLYTTDRTPFVAVWGQDETAEVADPSIDAGAGIVPLPSLLLQKTFASQVDTDCSGTVTRDDLLELRLTYFNNTANPIRNVIITDVLPPEIAYVPNSTRLNGVLLPDSSSGSPFLLDEGGYNAGDIPPLGNGQLTFNAVIVSDASVIINRADAHADDIPLGSDLVIIFTSVTPTPPLLQFGLAVVDPPGGTVTSGQPVTLGLTVTNTGNSTIIRLPAQITFNEQDLTFVGATLPPNNLDGGKISWDDLTSAGNDVPPGASTNVLLNFVVNDLSPTTTSTDLAARVRARRDDSRAMLVCEGALTVDLALPPTPTPPTPTPNDDNNNDNNDNEAAPAPPPPPPPPSPTPAAVAEAVATPALPVIFLPETGLKEVWPGDKTSFGMGLGIITFLGVGLASIYIRRKSKKKHK